MSIEELKLMAEDEDKEDDDSDDKEDEPSE